MKRQPVSLFDEFEDMDIDDVFNIYNYRLSSVISEEDYYTFHIKKKNGGYREINRPKKSLIVFQKTFSRFLAQSKSSNLNVSFGFEKGKSIVDGAEKHINKLVVINIDIKNFFKSITKEQVEQCLVDYFNPKTSVSELSTFFIYKGYLPTGAPTSPILSNYICEKLDEDLVTLCSNFNATYTRYADDLTFSYNNNFPPKEVIDSVIKILGKYGFKPNHNKIKVLRKNNRQEVTGLVVNEKVNLKREFRYNLKALFHNFNKKGYNETRKVFTEKFPEKLFLPTITGWLDHYGFIKGKKDKYYIRYNRLLYGIWIGDNYFEQGLNPDDEISKLKDLIMRVIKNISIEEKKTHEEISLKEVIEYFIHLQGREAIKKNWDIITGGYFLLRPEDEIDSIGLYHYFFRDLKSMMDDIIKIHPDQ